MFDRQRVLNTALYVGILLTFLLAADGQWDIPYLPVVIKGVTALGLVLFVWGFLWSCWYMSVAAAVPVGLLLLAVVASYAAWRFHMFSWLVATGAMSYAVWRVATHLGFRQRLFSGRVILDAGFAAGTALGRGWDEVRRGTIRMIWAEDGLRVGWTAGAAYSNSGYLLKKLPAADLRLEADMEPRLYGIGWDPGIHFYAENESDYSLSIGFLPAGSGPPPYHGIGGVSIRTGYWNGGWDFVEHKRVAAPPGQVIRVVVELERGHARVLVGEEAVELGFTRPLVELVVGAVKWRKEQAEVWPTSGEHLIRRVCVTRV